MTGIVIEKRDPEGPRLFRSPVLGGKIQWGEPRRVPPLAGWRGSWGNHSEGSPMRFFFSGFLFGGQKEIRLPEANLWSEARGIAAVRFPLFPKSHAPPGSGKERLLTIFITLSPSDGSEKKSPYFVKIGPYTAAHPPYIGTNRSER